MEKLFVLTKEDLVKLRAEIQNSINVKIIDFERKTIVMINEYIKEIIRLDNIGITCNKVLHLKINLGQEKKFTLSDLVVRLQMEASKIKNESELINELVLEIKDPKYRGKSIFDSEGKINEEVAKELDELILIINISINI